MHVTIASAGWLFGWLADLSAAASVLVCMQRLVLVLEPSGWLSCLLQSAVRIGQVPNGFLGLARGGWCGDMCSSVLKIVSTELQQHPG